VAGLALGSTFRAQALTAASVIVAVLMGLLAISCGLQLPLVVGSIAAALLTLQVAYLIGAAAAPIWSRNMLPKTDRQRLDSSDEA
jgi:hypothetical protein